MSKKLVRWGQNSKTSVATNSTSVSNWTTLHCNGFTSFEACLWRENLVQNMNFYVLPLFLPTIPLQEKKRHSILKLWKCENKSPMLRGWRCWHPYLEYPPLIKFQYFPQIFHLPIISLSVSILQRLAKLLNVKGWGKDQVFQIKLWIYHYWDFLWGWFQ